MRNYERETYLMTENALRATLNEMSSRRMLVENYGDEISIYTKEFYYSIKHKFPGFAQAWKKIVLEKGIRDMDLDIEYTGSSGKIARVNVMTDINFGGPDLRKILSRSELALITKILNRCKYYIE